MKNLIKLMETKGGMLKRFEVGGHIRRYYFCEIEVKNI